MWVKVGPEALPLSVEVYSLCFDKEVKWSVYINNCSVLYKPVDVMLCSMFAVRHFEYTSHAEQGFLCIPVCYHLCRGRKRQTEHQTPENSRAETRSDPHHLGPAPVPRQQRHMALRAGWGATKSNRESKLGHGMKLVQRPPHGPFSVL